MQCDYFDAGACRSCTLMGTPYAAQLAAKVDRARTVLGPVAPGAHWHEPFAGPESHFRNKAKLVVGGTRGAPTLGILDDGGRGVDLRHCGLYEPGLAEAVPRLAGLVAQLGLTPYDVPRRTGELKHVLVTHSPDDELMIRFVLRSEGQLGRLRGALEMLHTELPGLAVVTANLQPEHKAVLEGPHELVLTERETLPMRLDPVTLHLRPQSFFQTNTVVAQGLYAQAQTWIRDAAPTSLWDLYCGVGGFALHAVTTGGPVPAVTGVETSADAVRSAHQSADELGLDPGARARVQFLTGDATAYAVQAQTPELVVVNPPRRGIGAALADWLEGSQVEQVLYSSCNVDSLARDLARMPSLRPVEVGLFDMFPQTAHLEALIRLQRVG